MKTTYDWPALYKAYLDSGIDSVATFYRLRISSLCGAQCPSLNMVYKEFGNQESQFIQVVDIKPIEKEQAKVTALTLSVLFSMTMPNGVRVEFQTQRAEELALEMARGR